MNERILRAGPSYAAQLSLIAWEAKKHWGYPETWMAGWKNDGKGDRKYTLELPVSGG